jgi:hypothetical protein
VVPGTRAAQRRATGFVIPRAECATAGLSQRHALGSVTRSGSYSAAADGLAFVIGEISPHTATEGVDFADARKQSESREQRAESREQRAELQPWAAGLFRCTRWAGSCDQ